MKAITKPRKIDLAVACAEADIPYETDTASLFPPGAPIFLGYQARWFEDESQLKLSEKGRRTGITWAEVGGNVLTASKPKRRGGRNVFYVGSKQEMALEYIAAGATFARAFNEMAKEDVYEQTFWDDEKKEEILVYMIRFPKSGFKIQALSSRPSNLRGLQGDVVIDEAAFHKDLPELLKAAMALTMWGARVRLISTHNGTDNFFNSIIEDQRAGRNDWSIHTITLDDALKDGLYKRICYVTGQPWSEKAEKEWRDKLIRNAPTREASDEEYFCIPSQGSGTYFPRALVTACMSDELPHLRFARPDGWEMEPEGKRRHEAELWLRTEVYPVLDALENRPTWYGQDFARHQNLSEIWIGQETPEAGIDVKLDVELWNIPYRQQEQILMAIVDRLRRFAGGAMDARGNGEALAEYMAQEYGEDVIHQIKATESWYAKYFPLYRAYYEDRSICVPKRSEILDDHRCVRRVKGIPKIVDTQESHGKEKRHGDSAIAGCMLTYAVTEIEAGPDGWDISSAGKPASAALMRGF